jgi:hypothetical protein
MLFNAFRQYLCTFEDSLNGIETRTIIYYSIHSSARRNDLPFALFFPIIVFIIIIIYPRFGNNISRPGKTE